VNNDTDTELKIANLLGYTLQTGPIDGVRQFTASQWMDKHGSAVIWLPNFSQSVDACREFEETLSDVEKAQYTNAILCATVWSRGWPVVDHEIRSALTFADAPTRCAAFLRVKGSK